jgi:hypothetical protein
MSTHLGLKRLLAALLLLIAAVSSALLQPSAVADAASPAVLTGVGDVKALIAQLGDAKFAVRKSAGEKLAKIGLPAFQALEEATRDGDREIRYRAEKVLSVIRQNDLNRRLTIFLASLDSPEDKSLPSWPRFKAAHGNTKITRSLFVEMQRAEGELLAQLDADPRQATDLLGQRALALVQEQNRLNRDETPLPLGQIAAVFFVAGEPDTKPTSNTVALLLQLGTQQTLAGIAPAGEASDKQTLEKAALSRKLLGPVLARADGSATMEAVRLAVIHNLKEGLGPAVKLLHAPPRGRLYMVYVQYAMFVVARFGDDSHLAPLEKLFTDNTLISTPPFRGNRREIQVRDSALAAAVLLTKQELKDYFELPENLAAQQQGGPLPNAILSVGFENDEQRTAAFAKWGVFKAKTAAEPKK